jgi:hypothetical protein|tara:strand:+ start:1075 stop:1308 length:234 start_codon:yes stop_codon:yes gene_type:complete
MRCKLCLRTRCAGGARGHCWKEYQLCPLCAVVEHPEDYKKNYIMMTLSKYGKYKSPRSRFGNGRTYVVTKATGGMRN